MSNDGYQALLQLVHNRAGDALRTAVRYGRDDWSTLYVRDDLATQSLRDALPELVERARASEPVVRPDAYGDIGDTQATVELHDSAALLFFRESDTDGVIVSLDRDVAQGLGQFVNSCNAVLDDS